MTEKQPFSPVEESSATQPILVGIDFSEYSRTALLWACHHADRTNAPLVLLHVVHDIASNPGFYNKATDGKLQLLQSVAETMMAEFVEQTLDKHPDLPALIEAEQKFIPGLPPSRIVEVSNLLEASLIVIGDHGHSRVPHVLLGSVAERVVKLARRPVVVVKKEGPHLPDEKELKRLKKKQKKERKGLEKLLGLKKGDKANG